MARIDEMIKKLSPELQQEVEDFIEFLIEKHGKRPRAKVKVTYRGVLKDLRDKYSSVQLQHKAMEWWGNNVSS